MPPAVFRPRPFYHLFKPMQDFIHAETLVIELLLVVTLVAIAVRRLRIPYTVALVLVGLALALQQPMPVEVLPELILALFVPPLVFEAAFHIQLRELRGQLPVMLLLAVPGVVLTTVIVGGMVALTTPLTLPVALVFGAIISATDPVAVVALFRTLGVARRLATLVEGESLLNDGTAIVIFNLMLVIAVTGQFNLVSGVANFIQVSIGGTAVGLILGWMTSQLLARLDDYLVETALTMVLAFGSYLLADRLGFSGVLAVVAAGLVTGNVGPRGMSPTTRIVLFNFWENIAFLANSFVFLLIGLRVDLPGLGINWQPVVWGVAAVIASRVVVVYGLGWAVSRFGHEIPLAWRHVLAWGGLRGAISLALALSLPAALGDERHTLQLMTFGVVLFTILLQGTTMGQLVRRLGIIQRVPAQVEYETRHARLTATRSAFNHMEQLYRQGLLSGNVWDMIRADLEQREAALADAVREVLQAAPEIEAEELHVARREVLRAQRSALVTLVRDGVISQEVYEELTTEVDAVLVGEQRAPAPDIDAPAEAHSQAGSLPD
jgi:CPA1 family monovalent cation:H+ antiporter